MLVVAAGNRIDPLDQSVPRFPSSEVGRVTQVVEGLLCSLRPRLVIAAAAAGADLIVLGAAQRLGVATIVVLPIAEVDFLQASVADNGDEWVKRFHSVVGEARTEASSHVVELHLDDDPEWWYAANHGIIEESLRRHHPNEGRLGIAVRPAPISGSSSVTDHFVDIAYDHGIAVVSIDPRPEGFSAPTA